MSQQLNDRIETLETRLAYAEYTIEQLNDEVTTQGRELDRLKYQIQPADRQTTKRTAQPDCQHGRRDPAAALLMGVQSTSCLLKTNKKSETG